MQEAILKAATAPVERKAADAATYIIFIFFLTILFYVIY